MFHQQLQELLQKPMDRREFLTTLFKGFLALVGITAVMRGMLAATGHDPVQQMQKSFGHHKGASHGFGASRFGI